MFSPHKQVKVPLENGTEKEFQLFLANMSRNCSKLQKDTILGGNLGKLEKITSNMNRQRWSGKFDKELGKLHDNSLKSNHQLLCPITQKLP